MEDVEMVRALDRHMTRARAFNEVAVFLRSIHWHDAAESVNGMYDRELLKFDTLWDEYQSGSASAPVAR